MRRNVLPFVLATAAAVIAGDALAKQDAPAARGGDPYRDIVNEAYQAYKGIKTGKNSDYIPELAKADPNLFGLAIVTVTGGVYEAGAARSEFPVESIGKVFTLAKAVEALGPDLVQQRVGVNATGLPFNSELAVALFKGNHPAGNPLVNAGAITTIDMLPSPTSVEKWNDILNVYGAFAGRRLAISDEIYRTTIDANTHDRALVNLLKNYDVIKGDPMEALDIYTRACSVSVSARDLATMGATLANGGRNPLTRHQVVSAETARHAVAVMATAGLFETTGEWIYRVGVPAKSGAGGGIVAVVPGRFAIGVYSPPLDDAGNSVRGGKAIDLIVRRLGANLFASRPATPARGAGKPTATTAAAETRQSGKPGAR
jgi:glutaminase